MLLLVTLFLPLVVALILSLIPAGNTSAHRVGAAIGSGLTFVVSLALWFSFDKSSAAFQFTTNVPWISSLDIGFRFGLDGMSLLLVMLTTFIMPIAIMSSWKGIRDREKMYYIMLLILQSGLMGVFASLDTFLFYVFWEVVLIPMYFLIGIWGGKDRIYASMKFFLYTMAGSLLMLVAIVWLGHYAEVQTGHFTTDLQKLLHIAPSIPFEAQKWLFLAFALSFCIKVPIFPLHTWLPDAHTQAPTAGSVVLAAVMLKMGTYGLIRFNLQLFPQSSMHYADFISVLAVIGIIYGALLAMVQTDVKKLVAYSSIAHLGFVVLGIFSMTAEGVQGAVIQMVNHGLSTGMLFLLIGFIYDRRHTREMADFGGLAKSMPVYAVFFAIAVFASVGLPGLNGFVGEYLTLIGGYTSQHLSSRWFAIIGASGVILAAVYLLILFQRMFFGPLTNNENRTVADLSKLEVGLLVPMVLFCVWIGFQPNTFLSVSESSTRAVVGVIEEMKGEHRYAAEVSRRMNGDTTHIAAPALPGTPAPLPAAPPSGATIAPTAPVQVSPTPATPMPARP
ncbi:MAG: NADH-quinone oxidoreductase subunit M [Candidatus Kapaibacterium sp.]